MRVHKNVNSPKSVNSARDLENFIKVKYKGKFSTKFSVYKNSKEPIVLICKDCNKADRYCINKKTPSNLRSGKVNCSQCFKIANPNTVTSIEDLQILIKTDWLVLNSKLLPAKDKMLFQCKACKSISKKSYNQILQGKGCKYCSQQWSKPCYLYTFKLTKDKSIYYKIGITTKDTLQDRYSLEDIKYISEVKMVLYPTKKEAFNKEQSLIKQYAKHKVSKVHILKSGNTELFSVRIPI